MITNAPFPEIFLIAKIFKKWGQNCNFNYFLSYTVTFHAFKNNSIRIEMKYFQLLAKLNILPKARIKERIFIIKEGCGVQEWGEGPKYPKNAL